MGNNFNYEFKAMLENLGAKGTINTIGSMLDKGEIHSADFSLKALWDSCEAYKEKHLQEAVTSDLFPQLTSQLINSATIESYKELADYTDIFCTVVPSKLIEEKFAGANAGKTPDKILEGSSYPESEIDEKYVTALPSEKYGRIISVTREMIHFDSVGLVLQKARDIGRQIMNLKQKRIIQSVMDLGSWSGQVYRPSGVGESLFDATKTNLVTSCPFGEAGVLKALKALDGMVDEEGEFINIDPTNLVGLFPVDLWVASNQMIESTLTPEGTENAKNVWKKFFRPIRSPWATEASATDWFIGLPSAQFLLAEAWPISTYTQGANSDEAFSKDVFFRFKISYRFMIAARDFRYWLKCQA